MTTYENAGKLFKILGWLTLIAGPAAIAYPLIISIRETSQFPASAMIPMFTLLIISVGVCILQLKVGAAIQAHKQWGRIVGIILGSLHLIVFPIGTAIGAYILWCLVKGWDESHQVHIEDLTAIK